MDDRTHQSNGATLTKAVDSDGDGVIDAIVSYTYDENGNLLTEEYDSDGDGDIDETTTYGCI